MAKMEVRIISREVIKTSSPTIQCKRPYKLSLFDQLTPTTYSTLVFFYPMNEPSSSINITKTRINQLKKSFSEILNVYYPLSGRVIDNLFIGSFDEGVSFSEAQVNRRLSDFLKHHQTESLNCFVPFKPFNKEDTSAPIFAVQVNVFTCGGIALGCSGSHKFIDGATGRALFSSWASISRGDHNGVIQPDFDEASLFFPPRKLVPQNHLSLMESLWFTEANYITRRFVFDANAITVLKAKAKSGQPDAKVSRVEALTCFIWKSFMAASKAISGSPKPSILVEAVNLRPRTKPPMSDVSTGNVFWWAVAVASPKDEGIDLPELTNMLNEATALYDSDYTQTLQGEEGFESMSDYCDRIEELFSVEKPDIIAFTSWCYLGFPKTNFGWGEPCSVGLIGKVGPAFRNLVVFMDTKDGRGIEAWITLDQARMAVLESDPEFLALASPNPQFSSL